MHHDSLVSIVMCTYNGEMYLNEQIESVLKQDYQNFELIVVDDHSTDNTWKLLENWRKKDNRIRIFRNEVNLGYNKNFEKAIQLASGDFISICDQDDIWLPQKISKTVNAFTDKKVILAHCRSVRLENKELKFYKARLHHHFQGNDTRKLFFFNQIMGHDMVFRKELVSKIVPIPQGMSYDWWIAVIATCYGSVVSVEDYLVYHRIHNQNNFFNNNAASKKRELDLEDTLKLFSNIGSLNSEKKRYLHRLLALLSHHNRREKVSFNFKLFLFLLKNRKIVFGHKRRLIPEISYIKNAVKYAKLDYRGKGISI
jgi:glycosyltransferase involved in cell wall biosynthesis